MSEGAALGHNVAAAYEQQHMMRRLLDALGLLQQAHNQMCIQDNRAQEELRLCQQVKFCMAEGSKLASMQASITSAQSQPCSYIEILKVL